MLVLIALVAIGSVALATALPSRSWNRHIVAPIRGLEESARRMESRRGPAALDAEMIHRELQTAADAFKEVAGAVPVIGRISSAASSNAPWNSAKATNN